ncbi:MAG: hypothetical protein ACK4YF_09405 [Exilispira sp.]
MADDLFGIFNYDRFSFIFTYNITSDIGEVTYVFQVIKYDSENNIYFDYIVIRPQAFSFLFLFHKDIIIYGINSDLIIKLPIQDSYKIFISTLNLLFGLEFNSKNSILVFQSALSFGIYYQYFSIPKVSFFNDNNEGCYLLEFTFLINIISSVGIKISENIILKFSLYISQRLSAMYIENTAGFYTVGIEFFI